MRLFRRRNLYSACLPLLIAVVLTSCSLTSDELVALDWRGSWLLAAQHQTEPELNIRYTFTMAEHGEHEFAATAIQYLENDQIWDEPVDVQGRIMVDGSDLRIEFDFPGTGNGPEVALLSYGRVSQSSSLVRITGHSYIGESIGITAPGGGVFEYNTEIISMEQLANSQ